MVIHTIRTFVVIDAIVIIIIVATHTGNHNDSRN